MAVDGLRQHGTELLMDGSKVAAIRRGRPTIAQSNRQLIGLRPGFTSSIKRQRIHLNRTASIGPGSLLLLAKSNGRRCMKSSHLTWLRGLDLNQRPSGYEPDGRKR